MMAERQYPNRASLPRPVVQGYPRRGVVASAQNPFPDVKSAAAVLERREREERAKWPSPWPQASDASGRLVAYDSSTAVNAMKGSLYGRTFDPFHPQASPPPKPPAPPPTVSMAKDIAEAQNHKDDPLKLWWFYNQVKNRAPWDFKQRGRQYEDFGNYHYGVVGTAAGIPPELLRRAAGAAQILSGNYKPEFGLPIGFAPYGDDKWDQSFIDDGIRDGPRWRR